MNASLDSAMDLGFETVGNATVIVHDRGPVLVTDPWVRGGAYFGSWALSHEIPPAQLDAIQRAGTVWISHGHPDHLSGESLDALRDKTILLPDHVGGRIARDLRAEGYRVQVLPDRQWHRLTDRVRVMCVCDYFQDAVLLIEVGGRLVIDKNDANDRGWKSFVRGIVRRYPTSFLLTLSGFGDADMINLYDETGAYILPVAAKRYPCGRYIAREMEAFGATYFAPFSSFHAYQREDSAWANAYRTRLEDYRPGFYLAPERMLPAFIRWDCTTDTMTPLDAPEVTPKPLAPQAFGDDWSEPLGADEVREVRAYFSQFEHLRGWLDFVAVRVGGRDTVVELAGRAFKNGITFEVPRGSLMQAVRYQVFDDLLIGNFMRTTLHGRWTRDRLYPNFTPFVAKYGDGGGARTEAELHAYFAEYRRRAGSDYLRHCFELEWSRRKRAFIPYDARAYQFAKRVYWRLKGA